jgi:hypothetical protein
MPEIGAKKSNGNGPLAPSRHGKCYFIPPVKRLGKTSLSHRHMQLSLSLLKQQFQQDRL